MTVRARATWVEDRNAVAPARQATSPARNLLPWTRFALGRRRRLFWAIPVQHRVHAPSSTMPSFVRPVVRRTCCCHCRGVAFLQQHAALDLRLRDRPNLLRPARARQRFSASLPPPHRPHGLDRYVAQSSIRSSIFTCVVFCSHTHTHTHSTLLSTKVHTRHTHTQTERRQTLSSTYRYPYCSTE